MTRINNLSFVGKLCCFLLGLLLFSCNPYEQYPNTHYYIQAEVDPATAQLIANVQMVFIARQEYHDSICFSLNAGLEIHALTAQELIHYEFNKYKEGRLVLYIQDPVLPDEQILISMSYSGRLSGQEISTLDSSLLWYPSNEDTRPFSYQAKFALPGSWRITQPNASVGEHGKFLIQNQIPQDVIEIVFTSE